MPRSFINADSYEVDPEQIFLDSKNLPSFDTDRFEGRIEKALSKKSIALLAIAVVLVGVVYISRIYYLQISKGDNYAARSNDNSLEQLPLYAERGTIKDRTGSLLSWSTDNGGREYKNLDGMANVIGHLGFPTEEDVSSGDAPNLNHQIGKDGVEQAYNKTLEGNPGIMLVEHDAHGNITSQNLQVFPRKGTDVELTIDAAVQQKLFQTIKSVAVDKGFSGGAGVVIDVDTGELLALVTYPEYSLSAFASSTKSDEVEKYLKDKNKPFLNRAISGLYTPGSIVKPFMAIAALSEKVITPEKGIVSTGSISIPNPYDKTKSSVFKDWKAHGWVDMRHAISVSSDVYFYEVGGGFEDQAGMGINAINKHLRNFGFAKKTGIDLAGEVAGEIPSPEWKAEHFDGEQWFVGDTYHTAIGQYGFQVTPLQAAKGIASIATNGQIVVPHIVKKGDDSSIEVTSELSYPKEYYKVAQDGMRLSATEGTAIGLNIPGFEIAAKTGTAELGVKKQEVNSWVVGYFPYRKPKYAFAVVMERGPLHNPVGATYVMRQFMDWLIAEKPEYTTDIESN